MSAYFQGSKEEFYKFLGPRTSDIVTEISRPYRKIQKSCKDEDKDENGKKKVCGKWKSLDAAHLKDRTRKILIREILEEFGTENSKGIYKISIDKFEEEFRNKHKDFFKVIQFRCRKHHRAYDKKYKVEDIEDDIALETEETYQPNCELNFNTKSVIIKKFIISNISYLKDSNCRIAKISTDNWNFNLKRDELKKDFYLLCYNQTDFSVAVLKIIGNSLRINSKTSDKKKISLNIPYSESEFTEKKTGKTLKLVESFELEP
ncbi:hypothetical protein [Chryseobacterium gambrini]|uniref:Uncharacterized protein n=1 Tax=Chryseobacterium gambrini TaxID=373672 RepID=A0ABM8K3C9_9FLAO|nr:hypothetical protein CRDW_07980 [Chryseobacterium gambrini]